MNLSLDKMYLLIFLIFIFIISCEDTLVDTDEPYRLTDINNIIWTLESYENAGQSIDISSYATFRLGYNDSLVFGNDSCRMFHCPYVTYADSVIPEGCWGWANYCCFSTFSYCHFAFPYRYQILLENRKFVIYKSDEKYTFTSNFIKPVDRRLIDKTWILTSNTFVTLVFDESKNYRAEYSRDDTSNVGWGYVRGVIGIGDGNSIMFYGKGSGGRGIDWAIFLRRIFLSSSYSINNNSLLLTNEIENTVFEFTVLE